MGLVSYGRIWLGQPYACGSNKAFPIVLRHLSNRQPDSSWATPAYAMPTYLNNRPWSARRVDSIAA